MADSSAEMSCSSEKKREILKLPEHNPVVPGKGPQGSTRSGDLPLMRTISVSPDGLPVS
jgi:hypothetical protein